MRSFKYNIELYDVRISINILQMQCGHRHSIVLVKKVGNK